MAYERNVKEWNTRCRIEVIRKYNIEIIAIIKGTLRIDKYIDKVEKMITGSVTLVPSDDIEYTFPCKITTSRLDYKYDLDCHAKLIKYVSSYDSVIKGKVRLLRHRIGDEIEEEYDPIYVIDEDKNIKNNEILGHVYLTITNTNDIAGVVTISKSKIDDIEDVDIDEFNPIIDADKNIRKNEIFGTVKISQRDLEDYKKETDPYELRSAQHNEILGHVKIEQQILNNVILAGTAKINKYIVDITDPIDPEDDIYQETDINKYKISGNILYEKDDYQRDIYGKISLEKTGEIKDNYNIEIIDGEGVHVINNANELQCVLKYESKTLEEEVKEQKRLNPKLIDPSTILGHLKILLHYLSKDIECKVETRKLGYIYSIFCRIYTPPARNFIIPCRIRIENTNNKYSTNILRGSITLEPRDKYERDILTCHVKYRPGVCKDILSHAYIDAIYTRKEFNSNIFVVIPESIYLAGSIDVIEKKPCHPKHPILRPTEHYPISHIYDEPFIGRNDTNRIHIQVINNEIKSCNIINKNINKKPKDIDKISHPKGKIVIAVSPTWSYEPYVFKNSLITFLDRYYRKADISIIFGGNKRSDFDVENLALNYKIRKENLCRIDSAYCSNKFFDQNLAQKFIYCMNEFKKEEYPNILRVFMFINQPNWYYNDTLSSLATYCKQNNISTVAISPGGEYCEICEMDKIIDDFNNAIEWQRHWRNHRTDYINMRFPDLPDRIVY